MFSPPFEGTISAAMGIIGPLKAGQLYAAQIDGLKVAINIDDGGHVYAAFDRGEESVYAQYQRISCAPNTKFVLRVQWSTERVLVAFNSIVLGGPDLPCLELESFAGEERPDIEHSFSDVQLDGSCTEAEELFIETLRDLESRVRNRTNYSLTKAAGLLRLLIVDKGSLCHLANREHRIPLKFEVFDHGEVPELENSFLWYRPIWPAFLHHKTRLVGLDELLRTPAVYSDGNIISVYAFVEMAANAKGGVHFDSSRAVGNRNAIAQAEESNRANITLTSRSTLDLARVVYRGLLPLAQAIVDKAQPP